MLLAANVPGLILGFLPISCTSQNYVHHNECFYATNPSNFSFILLQIMEIAKQNQQIVTAQASRTNDSVNISRKWKVAKAMLLLGVVFGVSWLPYFIIGIILQTNYNLKGDDRFDSLHYFAN